MKKYKIEGTKKNLEAILYYLSGQHLEDRSKTELIEALEQLIGIVGIAKRKDLGVIADDLKKFNIKVTIL